jgi:acetylornithine deacetylase/succinyl-diaminopimelate desuccinylase-like protein
VQSFERTLQLAQALIEARSPNPPGDERAVAGVITDALKERGLPPPTVIAKERHRPNLLTTIDFGPGGRHLCLCGHMDTKPVGAAEWDTDPFSPSLHNDRLYGLGACDMKGALAAMIETAASIDGIDHGSLSLLFTADEENGAALGARFLAESQAVHADAIVIGEPTGIDDDWDHLHLISRGIANFTAKVRGDQGHSSLSDRRDMVNASVTMSRLMIALAEEFHPSAPHHRMPPLKPTVNAGVKVSGGVNFGVLPGAAEFAVDVRTLPGMERDRFESELQQWLEEKKREIPNLRATVEFEPDPRGWLPATEVSEDAAVAVAAIETFEDVFGLTPPLSAFPATTDAAWLQGLAGIPTLPAVGPGLLERAHAANEFVSLDALEVTPTIYAGIMRRFCAPTEEPR